MRLAAPPRDPAGTPTPPHAPLNSYPGGLLAQERPPGGGRPPQRRVQAVAAKRGADRGRGHVHVEPQELALDPLVAPGRVLPGQADDQLLRLLVQRWPARLAARVGPRTSHQASVPAQQRLGLDQEAGQRARGRTRLTAASSARSANASLGRGTWRRSTASWWRRTRISKSLAASPRASSTSSQMERHSVR